MRSLHDSRSYGSIFRDQRKQIVNYEIPSDLNFHEISMSILITEYNHFKRQFLHALRIEINETNEISF